MKSQTLQDRRQSYCWVPVSFLLAAISPVAWVEASWVDIDTPHKARTTKPLSVGDDKPYVLVFSDEFERDGRTFHDGKDPRWTAINKNDYTNAALHFYSNDNVCTTNGVLNITTELKTNVYKAFDEEKKVYYADKKFVQSGMLQSWNKFCFTGGIVEFSARLPGSPHVGGLWPALWLLGNLARATYVGSTDFVWPFSYNQCNARTRLSQEINACSRVNHFGLNPFQGRGSPEIDVIEAMQGEAGKLPSTHVQRPYQSASLQIAPGIETDRPVLGLRPHMNHWYQRLEYGNISNADLNPFFYGVTLVHKPKAYTYQSDALSANMQLNDSYYKEQHIYRVEWEPPLANGTGGYIRWFTDNQLVYGIRGESLQLQHTEIPNEPMYLLMNTAVSSHWGFPAPCPDNCDCDCFECGNPACTCGLPSGYCDNFPAYFEIDYVRVFQAVDEPKHTLGCSPLEKPTALFIEGHAKRYMEEGQRHPLEPVQHGGGACSSDIDCGGARNGTCSSAGRCVCPELLTGPQCLAHAGYYDFEKNATRTNFPLSHMVIPPSLILVIAFLIVGFGLSMLGELRSKSREAAYQKIGASESSFHPVNANAIDSYQNSASAHYALPQQKNSVTYCVIDGRLVDK